MSGKAKVKKSRELNELESLLEKDLRRTRPALGRSGVTREQLTHSLVRLLTSAVLLLVVYFLGVFKGLGTVAMGVILVALLELLLLFSGKLRGEDDGNGASRKKN